LLRQLPALLLLAACATPYQPFEGKPVLAAVRFEGNDGISNGDLMNHIATAPTGGFFTQTARYYDADLFAIDVKRIERWYNRKGYYDAKVKDVQEEKDDMGRVTLVVTIEEGKRAKVEQVELHGLEGLPSNETKDLQDALPLNRGDGFDEDAYEKSKDVLLEQLRGRGFAQAKVQGRVEVTPAAATASIAYQCEPGQRFKFGKLTISGNVRVDEDEIAFAAGIEPGKTYSPKTLALAQQRVYNLGAFSGVRVGVEELGEEPVADVRINVREAPFQTIRLGVGGSAETGRWELPRLTAEYTNRSLLGGLRRLELSSTIGYAFVPNPFPGQYIADQSGITTFDSAQVTVPNVFFPGIEWVTRGEYAREIQSGFSYQDVAARIGLLYRRGPHAVSLSMNFVRYFAVELRGTDLSSVSGAVIAQDCGKACNLLYPELRYTIDLRDNFIEPTQGFYGSVGLQQALKLNSSSFSYFRINPEVRAYAPFYKYAVLALRAAYGGLFTETASGASPFTQRFYLGGQNEQRGYAGLQQGPKLGATPCTVGVTAGCDQPYATETVPIGAKSAFLLSADLRVRADFIFRNLMIVPFIDASTWGDDPRHPFVNGLEIAPGLGLRYITPFGPIRLDVAWLLKSRDVVTGALKDDQGNVVVAPTTVSPSCPDNKPGCIGFSRLAFHLSLGEAF
jgi:translocation and assembly module TamA